MATELQIYDFAMAANGSFTLPVQGKYFRILTTTGNVTVIGDTFGKLGPISRGQGLADKAYNRLTILDVSGSANAGTILVSDANFIDQTLYGSISLAGAVALDSATLAALEQISVRPEAPTGNYVSGGALAVNTGDVIFTAASNTNGAIILAADTVYCDNVTAGIEVFIAKATAPANTSDGVVILMSKPQAVTVALSSSATLVIPQYVPAGLGLYYLANRALASGALALRSCRYKLL